MNEKTAVPIPLDPRDIPPPPGVDPEVWNPTFTAEEMEKMLADGITLDDVLRDLGILEGSFQRIENNRP